MNNSGFTLLQLALTLIIIGLIVGGILTGRSLIDAAAQSAQISQITKYNTAVVNFQTKYNGYLPGDIPDPYATNYGFQSRGQYGGEGDGNGVIEGNCQNISGFGGEIPGFDIACGELAVFWQDLSTANLIDTNVRTGAGYPSINSAVYADIPGGYLVKWLPTSKLGTNNFVYVFSVGGINYFAVSSVVKLSWYLYDGTNPGITVQQAYNIDSKIDDGLPQSGNVAACYVNENVAIERPISAAGNGLEGANGGNTFTSFCAPTSAATPYASTNCYDNNGTNNTVQTYSISKNANAQNCGLSFQFQTQ